MAYPVLSTYRLQLRGASAGDAFTFADAEKLHRETGRPVVFLSPLELQDKRVQKSRVMFGDATILRPDEVRRFWASTRLVAKLRPSASDEDYDVYVYPR